METKINLYGNGKGDRMIFKQLQKSFDEYIELYGDPKIGNIVISCGAANEALHPEKGDINLYWWWSFGSYDDKPESWLEQYLDKVSVKPDIILCPSKKLVEYTKKKEFKTLYLPLGVGGDFKPLELDREGLGYAGTRGHKSKEQEKKILGACSGNFEFVSNITEPKELNKWYNTKLITFGMTKPGQRNWGMVNNRVFEVLASGTPFILEEHPYVEEILGFNFPYQTDSVDRTKKLINKIENNSEYYLNEFIYFSEIVRENHSYLKRIKKLMDYLKRMELCCDS